MRVLPDKIQELDDILFPTRTVCLVSVPRMGKDNYPNGDGKFSNAPYLNFNDDKVKFDTNDVSNANDNYGTASGFFPKSLFWINGVMRRHLFFILKANESNRQASDLFHLLKSGVKYIFCCLLPLCLS